MITIKSFNGIGDLLYVTPTLRVVKQTYPRESIVVNTNYPRILEHNPYVDMVGSDRKEGVFLGYPDIIHRKPPTKHHILTDWEIVCNHYRLHTPSPTIQPEIYFPLRPSHIHRLFSFRGGPKVLVQLHTKSTFSNKKIWPFLEEFGYHYNYKFIPPQLDIQDLFRLIAYADAVVCIEGGIHNIAAAVGTPAVVLLGGLHKPEWTTYKGQRTITRDCELWRECYNPDPCKHKNEMWCMKDISVSEVNNCVEELLVYNG